MVEEVNQSEVSEKFTIPLMKEYAGVLLKRQKNYARLNRIFRLDSTDLYRYIRAVSANDPDAKYLQGTVDEVTGQVKVDEGKIRMLVEKYLFAPCKIYIEKFVGPLEIANYNPYLDVNFQESAKNNFVTDLTYHMIPAAYQACRCVRLNEEDILKGIELYARLRPNQ